MIDFFKSLLMPPGINMLLLVVGFIIHHWWKWTGRWFMFFGIVSLYLFSTMAVSHRLLFNLERYPALVDKVKFSEPKNTAIVILGGGRLKQAPEYQNEDTPNAITLERLRYGFNLSQQYRFPILLSGGAPENDSTAEAVLMNQIMVEQFQVPVKFLETSSRNTLENAQFSSEILRRNHITHILLVTSAWHMKRALAYFRAMGIEVTPAPTGFFHRQPFLSHPLKAFFPSAKALAQSRMAIKEFVALWWTSEKSVAKELQILTPTQPLKPKL